MIKNMRARLSHYATRMRGAGVARRLIHQQEGATAVEFGLVAAPFLAMLFAIIETAAVFFAGQALETAAADSARLIMTGQAQMQGYDEAKFKEAVCARIQGLFNCSAGIKVDVRTYTSFASINTAKPIDANGNLSGSFTFDPGKQGDIVVVRLMYQWPVHVSLLGLNLADMAGGKRLLLSTVAFRNEPW